MATKPFPFSVCKECAGTGGGSGGGGVSITVDEQMSDTSENPVQNKVIKKYVDDNVGNIETALNSIIAMQNELIGGDAS